MNDPASRTCGDRIEQDIADVAASSIDEADRDPDAGEVPPFEVEPEAAILRGHRQGLLPSEPADEPHRPQGIDHRSASRHGSVQALETAFRTASDMAMSKTSMSCASLILRRCSASAWTASEIGAGAGTGV